MYIFILSFQWW